MDNNKVSHMDYSVKPVIFDKIEETFWKLSCTKRKKHTLLSMGIKFIGRKKVAFSTSHHVEEALEDFGETLKGNIVNPATS